MVGTDEGDITMSTTRAQALLLVYDFLNRPHQAGPVWAKYRREGMEKALDIIKQLAIEEGVEFKNNENDG